MIDWKKLLIVGGCSKSVAEDWFKYFEKHCNDYDINTPLRISAFIANVLVESNYLRSLEENLNYSAIGLSRTWPNRYSETGRRGGKPNIKAISIARKPELIANHCYANRMGNGDESSGEGWLYRGRGPIQITGKSNYCKFFNFMQIPETPDKLSEPDLGTLSAVWYWNINNINKLADEGNFDACCDVINIGRETKKVGDSHGYAARKEVYNRLLKEFNIK